MHVLNRTIMKAIIKEEEETAKRYAALAKRYNIPELLSAAHDEAKHAELFKRIMRDWRK